MEELLEVFRNNIFCRRESNQCKARKYWKYFSSFIPEGVKTEFEKEWLHYLLGDISIGGLAWHIDDVEKIIKECAKNHKGIEIVRTVNPHELIVKNTWKEKPSKN